MIIFRHRLFPRRALWLSGIIAGFLSAFPTLSHATTVTGGTTTTMVLTYVNGVQKWVCRIDPLNVQGFQLDIIFDPARCALDQAVGVNGVIYKFPFEPGGVSPDFSQLASGRIQDITGDTDPLLTSPGDVDIFELVFTDLQPAVPIDGVSFTVLASSNDSVIGFDPVTMQTVIFGPAQIGSTTRTSTTGVAMHVWDPDTVYNNGTTGGPGTWDTTSSSWDDLPLASPFSDTAWNNATHPHDIAVFGGNPGTGIVTLSGPIAVGGFQFDNSGYHIQSNIITLSAPPGGASIIDTGANSATLSSTISGNGFTKVGTGTLVLASANNYTGGTNVNSGTLLANNAAGSGTGPDGVSVSTFGTLGGTGTIAGPVTFFGAGPLPAGALLGGDGTTGGGALTLANNVTLSSASGDGIIKIALAPSGAHSTLTRAGGTWTFGSNQAFAFIDLGAQPGFYDNIITGLAADPGSASSWTITNPGWAGTFIYDGAGNIDLNLTAAPHPALLLNAAVSRKLHGHGGVFDINLPLSGVPGVECRSAGGNYILMFTFSHAITGGNASVTGGTGTISGSPIVDGNVMTVNLSGVANAQTLTVTLSNVTDSFAQTLPSTPVSVKMLVSDTNGDTAVNSADIAQTKSKSGVALDMSSFREDVNVDGSINSSDISLVKSLSGTSVP